MVKRAGAPGRRGQRRSRIWARSLALTLGAASLVGAYESGSLTVSAAAAQAKLDAAKLKKQLESQDPAEIREALEQVTKAGTAAKALVPTLNALLTRGTRADLLPSLIEATGRVEDVSSSAPLAPYLRHRTPAVRQAAVKALSRTKGPEAIKALTRGLRSQDAVVRGVSASALGDLGAKAALPDLQRAFDQKVLEAAVSIGQLCDGASCDEFLKRLGKVRFDVMTAGLDQMLFRPASSMKDEAKLNVVSRLRALGTAEASRYLTDVAGRWPKDYSARVKQALEEAAKATSKGASAPSDDDEDEEDDE
ncbi:MAG: HEAT repeat domain-containing protein [Polyangiaceae bacterium]|nr:HEAT repeat domain-containing protein [Polyangiaceae bacterium]MCW5792118.1 HEAT repeat domain-containing protein [Polyangiaceae bacterium]